MALLRKEAITMKKYGFRVLSFVLAVALLWSVVSTGSVLRTAVSAVEALEYVSSDDFSNAVASAAKWNVETSQINGENLVIDEVAAANRVTPRTWSDNVKPFEMTFDFRMEASLTGGQYFDFAYDTATGVSAGLRSCNEDGLMLRNYISGTGMSMSHSGNEGKLVSSKWANAENTLNADHTKWLTVKAVYDWSQWDSADKLLITYNVKVYNAHTAGYVDIPAKTVTYTFPENHGETIVPAFYGKGTEVRIDNVRIVTTGEKANAYMETYKSILDFTAASDNEELFLAAANAYFAADGQTQKHLAQYNAKIETLGSALLAGMGNFAEDNFENAWYSSKYWDVTGIAVRKEEQDNHYMQLTGGASLTVADQLWPQASKAQTARFSFRFDQGAGKFYLLYDKATGTGVSIGFRNQDGGYFLRSDVDHAGITQNPNDNSAKLATVVKAPGWTNNNYAIMGNWQRDQWTTIEAVYDYTDWELSRQISITYTVTLYGYVWKFEDGAALDSDDSYVIKQCTLPAKTVVYTLDDSVSPTLGIAVAANSGVIDVDNISVGGYYSSAIDIADEFAAKYGELLDKEPGSLNDAEQAVINEAIEEYVALPDTVKDVLAKDGVSAKLARFVPLSQAAQDYKDTYQSLLSMEDDAVTPAINDTLVAARAAFDSLAELDKLALAEVLARLNELRTLVDSYVEPRPEGDYSAFTEDFENGLKNWVVEHSPRHDGKNTNAFAIVADPLDSTNKVLWVKSYGDYLTINRKLVPSDAVITKYTGRILYTSNNMEGNVSNANRFILSYTDPDNYTAIRFSSAYQNTLMTVGYDDGDSFSTGWGGSTSSEDFVATEWVDFEITYNGITVTIVFTDKNGETKTGSAKALAQNGSIAFGSTVGGTFTGFYVDDLKVTYEKADFDLNVRPEDIVVYYHGNTQMRPGETVTIEGENLFNTVSHMEILQLPNRFNGTVGFISEESFNHLASDGSVAPYWNDSAAVPVEILQKTSASMKFKIPADFTQGVYALKLYAKVEGKADRIIYINNPEISFVIGDDGEVATNGGWIKIVGSNVSNAQNENDIKIALKKGNDIIILDSDDIDTEIYNDEVTLHPFNSEYDDTVGAGDYRWDDYAVKVNIPENLEHGTYEVLVYNGFGDETAWSQPGTIEIGVAQRDKWPTTVFDVTDYGAKGDSTTNDTPAVISAIEALYQNGGGVLYFPKGIYRLVATLALPENIKVMGDGIGKTVIMWTATHWMLSDAPDALLSIGGNVEICDMSLYATRRKDFIRHNGGDNVYIHDIHLQASTYAGGATNGDTTGITSEITALELRNFFESETKRVIAFGGGTETVSSTTGKSVWRGPVTNVQMQNITMDFDESHQGYTCLLRYSNINNVEFKFWSTIEFSEAGLLENCYTEGACVGNCGNMYMKNCYWEGAKQNNHEILTTDGTHKLDGTTMQFIGQNQELMGDQPLDNMTYRLMSNRYAENELLGYEVYVISGQGLGQVRKIVYNKDNIIKLDQPFVVNPNRNSLIAIQKSRSNQFWVDNTFCNGSGSGTYGSMINTVIDNTLFIKHGGQIFNTHLGVNWYITIVNNTLESPFYMHGQGLGNTAQPQTEVGRWQFLLLHGLRRFSSQAILFKNNSMMDGGYFELITNSKWTRDFVMEGNYFSEDIEGNAIRMSAGMIDGLLITGNVYDCEETYTEALRKSFSNAVNSVGDYMAICLEIYSGDTVLGDINLDGKVDTKDVNLIRSYLIGEATLTDEQKNNADLYQNGKVNLKDILYLQAYILTGEIPDDDNGYFDGIW